MRQVGLFGRKAGVGMEAFLEEGIQVRMKV